jgi:hypothetical protein
MAMSDEIYPEERCEDERDKGERYEDERDKGERYEDERFGDLTQGDFTIAVEHAGIRELIDAIKGLSFEPPSGVCDQPAPSLAAGNRLTQSLFSEIRFGLGTRDFTGPAPTQQLTSLVEPAPGRYPPQYQISYPKAALPADAKEYDLVYLAGPDVVNKTIPSADHEGNVKILLPEKPDAATLLAVRLRNQTEVVLVSVATHPITASTPIGRNHTE